MCPTCARVLANFWHDTFMLKVWPRPGFEKMSAYQYLCLSAIGLMVLGWTTRAGADDDDVTILKPSAADAATANSSSATNPDGTPVVHKSSHRKNKTAVATTAAAKPTSAGTTNPAAATTAAPSSVPTAVATTAAAPAVETDLPIARPGSGMVTNNPEPIPAQATMPSAPEGTVPRRPYVPYRGDVTTMASFTSGSTVVGGLGTYSPNTKPVTIDNVKFTDFEKRTQTYPWKQNIVTTLFWIGEGSTPISATTNVASAWDEDWRRSNSGSDSPDDEQGYVNGSHASTQNPFYVALPFNDLSEPELARRWLPAGWYHPSHNGEKPESACRHRWVEIKNRQGEYCYAQWEDVGPLRSDDAEYVFGSERPQGLGDHHAGLDVSPAVAKYLHIDGKNDITSWRFVDFSDVVPGLWLKYDEEAVIFQAIKSMKDEHENEIPIQRTSEPIEDKSIMDDNERKVSGARG